MSPTIDIIIVAAAVILQSLTIMWQGRTIRKLSKQLRGGMHDAAGFAVDSTERIVNHEYRLLELERKWN